MRIIKGISATIATHKRTMGKMDLLMDLFWTVPTMKYNNGTITYLDIVASISF